jgi:hypothetical protein
VSASIVANSLPDSFGNGGQVSNERVGVQGFERLISLKRGVEVVYVSLMMLPMMDFHGSTVEVRFERIG